MLQLLSKTEMWQKQWQQHCIVATLGHESCWQNNARAETTTASSLPSHHDQYQQHDQGQQPQQVNWKMRSSY